MVIIYYYSFENSTIVLASRVHGQSVYGTGVPCYIFYLIISLYSHPAWLSPTNTTCTLDSAETNFLFQTGSEYTYVKK